MKVRTEAEVQKLLNIEGVLILIAIGADILIEALKNHDWIAAAVIIAGFCIIGGLYWHTLYLDRLFADLHEGLHRIFSHHQPVLSIPAPMTSDVAAARVAERPILHVSNFTTSRNFYARTLAPLGYALTAEFPTLLMAAFGTNGSSDLWIKGDGAEQKLRAAFSASSRQAVDDFCTAALATGAIIAEVPGLRPLRGEDCYAGAIYDPDGYTIEAVWYGPSSV